jgi:hypothetical protein
MKLAWTRFVNDFAVQCLQLSHVFSLRAELEPVVAPQAGKWLVVVFVPNELDEAMHRPALFRLRGEKPREHLEVLIKSVTAFMS